MSLSVRHLMGNNVLLKASASRISRNQDKLSRSGSLEPIVLDYTSGVEYSGGYDTTQNRLSRRTAATASASGFWGKHTLKAGIEFEDNFLHDDVHAAPPGIVERQAESSYTAIYYDVDNRVSNRVLTLYLQDSWQLHEKLRLNAGLRLDAQYVIAPDGGVAQSITDQYQTALWFRL